MKFHILFFMCLMVIGLVGCQTMPPTKAEDIDSDVCIGEPVVVEDPDKPVDLEEMAKQADCP